MYVAQVCAFSEDIRVLSSPPFTGHLSSPIPINGWSQVMVIGWAHGEAIVLCAVPGKICAKLKKNIEFVLWEQFLQTLLIV